MWESALTLISASSAADAAPLFYFGARAGTHAVHAPTSFWLFFSLSLQFRLPPSKKFFIFTPFAAGGAFSFVFAIFARRLHRAWGDKEHHAIGRGWMDGWKMLLVSRRARGGHGPLEHKRILCIHPLSYVPQRRRHWSSRMVQAGSHVVFIISPACEPAKVSYALN